MFYSRTSRFTAIALCFAVVAPGVDGNPYTYHITEIPAGAGSRDSLAGIPSKALGINAAGEVAGVYFGEHLGETSSRAFLYRDGVLEQLGTLGGDWAVATAINDTSQVVGWSANQDGQIQPFRYSNGVMENLGTLGGDWAMAVDINHSGQVAGWSYDAEGQSRPFRYHNGTMEEFGSLGWGDWGEATAINDAGEIVGWTVDGSGSLRAFRYSRGEMENMGTLGGYHSWATGINDGGQIVGWSDTEQGHGGAFRYHNGVMEQLSTLGEDASTGMPYAINNSGKVVGNVEDSDNRRAFLHTGLAMLDLNDHIDPASGWSMATALDINDHGQIVGTGINAAGEEHVLLLTPPAMLDPEHGCYVYGADRRHPARLR